MQLFSFRLTIRPRPVKATLLFDPWRRSYSTGLHWAIFPQVCPRLKPHAILAESGAGLVAKATYLVRRGRLRYQLIAKATYLRLRLRFILRSSGKRINAARLLEIGGPAKRLAQFFLV
jgi:hypothetical protein